MTYEWVQLGSGNRLHAVWRADPEKTAICGAHGNITRGPGLPKCGNCVKLLRK